eukprot:TRINITY_DN15264_c0_g1_i3.p1 TRINITY_DN15264_c0_g1~~TRINITY_DN15264_c0_g1_i3.p1  ORF type:complete len:146 (+),score=29.32 TRINITY_DN15264_c0_g1_i3:24-461(+)
MLSASMVIFLSSLLLSFHGYFCFFFLMIRRPPRSTQGVSSAASDVYKRQGINAEYMGIGLFHNNTVKGMETISGNSCTSGSKYIVKVDMVEHFMIIKGPSCHLKATLKVDTEYVPCFSLGCRNNKMIIKPLDIIDIDEQLSLIHI